jgi:glycine reductase
VTLALVSHRVRSVDLGPATQLAAGRLTVAPADAERLLRDAALASVRVSWASPGDSLRIVKVLDAVEPRTKGKGGGGIFPGFLGPVTGAGSGETHRLEGVAVIAAGYLPRAQEAVIEMAGQETALCPFSSLHNLVVEFKPAAGAAWEMVDAAVRRGTLRLAAFLAEAALDHEGDDVTVLEDVTERKEGIGGLPYVGVITNLQTQGTFKDVFVYGDSFAHAAPTLIEPNELADGAVVSGQFGHPSLKNPTWMHQNHPVVRELRARDGRDLRFAGVVLTPEPVQADEKRRVAVKAATLCADLGWDGVVITKEGGGNADADISLKMDALADLGVESVGLFAELAGPLGTAPSLVVPPDKATALISTGNYDEILHLPAVERALGGVTLDLVSRPATDACDLPVAAIYCSLSPLGGSRLTCREVA